LKNSITAIVVISFVSLLSSAAFADPMTYNGVGLNGVVTTHAPGLLADNLSVYAGQELVQYHGINYLAYCVDLNQYSASSDVTMMPVTSLPRGEQVAFLYNTYGLQAATGRQAAAVGVAIWELVAETGPTLDAGSGYFHITDNANAIADANVLLANLPTHYNNPIMPFVLHSTSAQDFVVGSWAIPEPATLALLAIGGLLFVRKGARKHLPPR
jgi:hypothetical protein